jgi:hypothetical protein
MCTQPKLFGESCFLRPAGKMFALNISGVNVLCEKRIFSLSAFYISLGTKEIIKCQKPIERGRGTTSQNWSARQSECKIKAY